MANYKLLPEMIAREITRLVSHMTNHFYENSISSNLPSFIGPNYNIVRYRGVNCDSRYEVKDDKIYFDIWAGANLRFDISFPSSSVIWTISLDDFAEKLLIPKLYKKLEHYGYATWD